MHVDVYFVSALAGVALFVWQAAGTYKNRRDSGIKEMITAAIAPLLTDVAVVRDRVDTMWETWQHKIVLDQVAILHHPEPSRLHIDYLLDVFREGTITHAELTELKRYLVDIIQYDEEHAPAPFKVFQGEQTAASIVLHTIDHMVPGE